MSRPVLCIGSINADFIYRLPHLPAPGETLTAESLARMSGGKGANQSIAASLAGARVSHIGAVGEDGGWLIAALKARGVDCAGIARVAGPTGHAVVYVDDGGENTVIVHAGANRSLTEAQIDTALAGAPGFCLLQNETNLVEHAAALAVERGWTLVYSAAPFDAGALARIAPHASIVILNDVEARQFRDATGKSLDGIGVAQVIVTRGAKGARLISGGETRDFAAPRVTPVDTTGAGDTFSGVLAASLAAGLEIGAAISRAQVAAAIQVTRPGTSDAMPTAAEIDAFS